MPVPRGEDRARNGDTRTSRTRLQAAGPPQARYLTEAERRRCIRAGIRVGVGTHNALVWSAPRNGLPEFRPYVYRGSDREVS